MGSAKTTDPQTRSGDRHCGNPRPLRGGRDCGEGPGGVDTWISALEEAAVADRSSAVFAKGIAVGLVVAGRSEQVPASDGTSGPSSETVERPQLTWPPSCGRTSKTLRRLARPVTTSARAAPERTAPVAPPRRLRERCTPSGSCKASMIRRHGQPPPSSSPQVAALGTTLAALASSDDDLECLDVFANLLDGDADALSRSCSSWL